MHAFDVLGDPVRRRILELLAEGEGERSAGDVAEVIQATFGISQPAVSQHLRVLRESGFVVARVDGPRRLYSVEVGPMQEVDAWLDRFRALWERRLDALGTEIARGRRQKPPPPPPPPSSEEGEDLGHRLGQTETGATSADTQIRSDGD